MDSPHISVNFKFNDESLQWLQENLAEIISDFERDFPEEGGPIHRHSQSNSSMKFQLSPLAIQIRKFLRKLNFTNVHVQLFGYKSNDKKICKIENIHIDNPGLIPLPARFNVLIEGNDNSRMHWWDIDMNHKFIHKTNTPIGTRWQIPGSPALQVKLLGPPDYSSGPLSVIQQTGDFVKTDVAHCIERDGEKRFIISTQIHHPWKEITEKVQKWKNQ